MNFTLIDSRTLIIGKTKSGKSELSRYLLTPIRPEFQKIFVFSGTEKVNSFYKKFINPNCIYNEFNSKFLQILINKITDMKMQDTNYNKKFFLIFDDVGTDITDNKELQKLFTMGRHLNISIVVLLQYLSQVKPVIRDNASYILIGQQNAHSVELLADNFLNGNLTRKQFINLYHENTKDHNFLIVSCESVKNNDNINELYGCIKAELK